MQFRAVGRAVLHRAHPFAVLRVVVDAGKRRPGHAAVLRPEQALRRRTRVPGVALAGVTGREPEGVVHRPRRCTVRRLGKGRGLRRFLPGAAEIGRAEDGGAQVPRLGCCQQRAPVARVQPQVMDLVAQEMRAVDAPGLALGVAVKQPGAFARGDEQHHLHWRRRRSTAGGASGRWLAVSGLRGRRRHLQLLGISDASCCHARGGRTFAAPDRRAGGAIGGGGVWRRGAVSSRPRGAAKCSPSDEAHFERRHDRVEPARPHLAAHDAQGRDRRRRRAGGRETSQPAVLTLHLSAVRRGRRFGCGPFGAGAGLACRSPQCLQMMLCPRPASSQAREAAATRHFVAHGMQHSVVCRFPHGGVGGGFLGFDVRGVQRRHGLPAR